MRSFFKNEWRDRKEYFEKEYLDKLNTESFEVEDVNNQSNSMGLLDFGSNGFTSILLSNGEKVSIPQYCKVANLKFNRDKTREEFLILDWPYENKLGSVKSKQIGISRFGNVKYEQGAKIYFNKSNGEIRLGNSGVSIPAYTNVNDPIPNGIHKIWLPDYPHDFGYGYLQYSKYSYVWFRLGNETSTRYLHVGSVSEGCVSVGKKNSNDNNPEFNMWEVVYTYLSNRRLSPKHVGELVVS